MNRLSKSDPIIECTTSDTGENIIACVGELHAEISINDLKMFSGIELNVSEPVISFRETITDASGITCLKKSANKHNRIFMQAEPLPDELVNLLESGEYGTKDMVKLSKMLVEKFGWDKHRALKIWAIGPYDKPSNIIVDCTVGLSYLNEVKDGIVGGFTQAILNGILAEEPIRGVQFNLMDLVLHADAIHRGAGQMMPTTRDCIYACMLANKPTLFEPIYNASITTVRDRVGTIYSCLSHKRGEVVNEESSDGTPTVTIQGHLPVIESFGFDSYVKEQTSGQAFPSLSFSHWKQMEGKLRDDIVNKIRNRKHLKPDIPKFEEFNDKL